MNNEYLFTSESVSPGHPDKLSDQLSDAVLDYVFDTDKNVVLKKNIFASNSYIHEKLSDFIIKKNIE